MVRYDDRKDEVSEEFVGGVVSTSTLRAVSGPDLGLHPPLTQVQRGSRAQIKNVSVMLVDLYVRCAAVMQKPILDGEMHISRMVARGEKRCCCCIDDV